MIRKVLAAALPLSLALAAVTSDAAASNYPPSYNYCGPTTTAYSGPFELIQDPVRTDSANLTVAYRGYLRGWFPDNEINIYVRLNGNDAFLPAASGSNGDAYIFVSNAPQDCALCGGYPYPPECNGSTWVCSEPTATEEHLFFWAYNEYSMNAWDIEVAAESHGYWDSNYGANYHAHFDARLSCF
jgi:hypothetical protein